MLTSGVKITSESNILADLKTKKETRNHNYSMNDQENTPCND